MLQLISVHSDHVTLELRSDYIVFVGNTSSLLCLCGISVSLAFYVLYLKFYPRCYDSVFLKRVLKRLLQTRSQRQASSISSRKKQTLQHATSLSIINENCSNEDDDDDNNNNSIKTSDAVRTDFIDNETISSVGIHS